jgi:hypothetical protein
LNPEKDTESNCTKKTVCCYLKKLNKLTLDPCKVGLARATFYTQLIALPEPFNLMYLPSKSDFKQERYKLGSLFFVITVYFSGNKLLVASGPYLKNRTNYFTAMTFSFTPDAKLINVKIPT